ncbi:MAG: outer membrane beta-barrel protein [Filimonas sp.]|nr:outer membrane beta-barrel protein [Filimonas sp.]
MLHILRKQIIFLLIAYLCCTTVTAHAQFRQWMNRPEHDNWPYYFGMSLAYNNSYIHTSKSTKFLQSDSILYANPGSGSGIALGLLATLKLTNRFELRANPQLIIGGARTFTYRLKYPALGEDSIMKQSLPSTIVSFPFQIKFNSDRIRNFRTYLLAGVKYDIDLASNSAARNAENLIKLKKYDASIDVGIGFNFYLPFVTLSPELRFSSGLMNIHSRDPNLKYSSVFDKLQSRMFFITLNLED